MRQRGIWVGLRVVALAALLAGCANGEEIPLIGSSGTAPAPRPPVDDGKVSAAINDRLTSADKDRFGNVHIDSVHGHVLLTGVVASSADASEAERLARQGGSAAGMVSLDNKLQSGDGGGVGSYAGDSWITTKIKTGLLTDFSLNGFSIGVETVRGIVYLTGIVSSREQRETAVKIARGVSGVVKVVSAIQIGEDGGS